MGEPIRILIAEDSEDDAVLLIRTLRRGGYEVTYERVDSAVTMNTALNTYEWDVVISDYVMPQFSGIDALRLVQSRGLDIPFIIVSGKIGEDIAVDAMRSGAQDYIMKSNLARLIPAIQRELQEADVRRKRRKAEEQLRIKDAAIASSINGIIIADLDNTITYANDAFLDLWGYEDISEVLGMHVADFWASREQAMDVIKLLGKSGSWVGEMAARKKIGHIFYVHMATSIVIGNDEEPLCMMVSLVDITERKVAEAKRRELEAHQRDFYRRTILAATAGKLVICDKLEIEAIACPVMASWCITDAADLSPIRRETTEITLAAGMDQNRAYDFILAIGEATTNAVKHAGGGNAFLCTTDSSVTFVVSDTGPGIEALVLPEVVLTGGRSTAGTLGVGYKTILSVADMVYLATGPAGTTLAIKMNVKESEKPLLLDTFPDVYIS